MADQIVTTPPTQGKSFPNGVLIGNRLHLTPALFSELDARARTVAGHICHPSEEGGMRGDFASLGQCREALFYLRLPDMESKRPGYNLEDGPRGLVNLAQAIDLEAFRSAWRPEIDWSAIPVHNIYRFLLEHELAHARHRDNGLFSYLSFGPMGRKGDDPKVEAAIRRYQNNRAAVHSMRLFIEARADREAWQTLYSDAPMPTRADAMPAEDLVEIHDKYAVLLDRHERMKPLEPVALFPHFVLKGHVECGFLLWSPEVCEGLLTGTWHEALAPVRPGNRIPNGSANGSARHEVEAAA